MAKRKDVLTTGEVANICNVAPRTVTKWFDSGKLKGYRIPGSRDRRIPLNELRRFMKAHNIPVAALRDISKLRVLIVDSDVEAVSGLKVVLERAGYEIQTALGGFDAGIISQKFQPHVLLVKFGAEGIEAEKICRNLRSKEDLEATKVIATASQLSSNEAQLLLSKGFDAVIADLSDVDSVVRTIEEVTAIIY